MGSIKFITPKRLVILAVLLLSIPLHMAVKGMVWFQEKELLRGGQPAPTFRISDEKERIWGLEGFRGKVLLLSFCKLSLPVCKAQAKNLNTVAGRYNHKGLEVLFIADSPSLDEMQEFDKNVDADFYILQDRGGRIRNRYNVENYPTNYFVDKEGIIITVYPGRIKASSSAIRDIIENALEAE